MGRLVGKLHPETDSMMQCHTQARNITTNHKVEVYFTLPTLSATKVIKWNCYMDDSSKGKCNMILGRDLLV